MEADDMDFGKGQSDEHSNELIFETRFKGRPVLVMKRHLDDKYPLSMGMGKIKLCLENVEAMEAFAKKHSKEED